MFKKEEKKKETKKTKSQPKGKPLPLSLKLYKCNSCGKEFEKRGEVKGCPTSTCIKKDTIERIG